MEMSESELETAASQMTSEQFEDAFMPAEIVVVEVGAPTPLNELAERSDALSEATGESVVLADSCWATNKYVLGRSLVGVHLFKHWIRVSYCSNGKGLTSVRIVRAWPESQSLFWSFEGEVDRGVWRDGRGRSGRAFVQAHWFFDLAGYPVQHSYPCIRAIVYPSGSSTHDLVCYV